MFLFVFIIELWQFDLRERKTKENVGNGIKNLYAL